VCLAYHTGVLAQSNSSDAGAVWAVIFGLALIGLEIYLVYAIIATRQDVKSIRALISGGAALQHRVRQGFATGEWTCTRPDCDFWTEDAAQARAHESLGARPWRRDIDDHDEDDANDAELESNHSSREFKACPDCAEEVRAAARKCRYCGYMFEVPDIAR
jgi:Uncharacterised protein family UPF0547